MLDYKFFSQLTATLMKLCHISATTQFKSYAQNVHHRPKRTQAFSDVFPKQLGIFSPNFTCLLRVPTLEYTIFIQLPLTVSVSVTDQVMPY